MSFALIFKCSYQNNLFLKEKHIKEVDTQTVMNKHVKLLTAFAVVLLALGSFVISQLSFQEGPTELLSDDAKEQFALTGAAISEQSSQSFNMQLSLGAIAAILATVAITISHFQDKTQAHIAKVKTRKSLERKQKQVFSHVDQFQSKYQKDIDDIDNTIDRLKKALE